MPLTGLDKREIMTTATAILKEQIGTKAQQAKTAADGATHEESRSEGSKDTRSTEASYLARGQAQRVAELEADLQRMRFMEVREYGDDDAIASSALIALANVDSPDAAPRILMLAPCGGGIETTVQGRLVQFITPTSPLGRALLGKRVGDEVDVRVRTKSHCHEILAVK